ncbi:hypothetical protein [Pseudonocardia nigra]|uniref:hypothetical protein n=1 Tax=Pseudonocardia nigra TaxID=1921578 RepID=UPI001C5DC799|nr:hypothetical protein [Pseudonocardia nigra]
MAKRLDHPYAPTRRAWRKVKGRASAEAIVGGILGSLRAPAALVLGRPDETGRLRVAGRTGPIPRHVRAAVGAALQPAGGWHPWPDKLPSARFGNAAPVDFMRVEPALVVELAVDAAVDVVRGRPLWRHPARLIRVRHDLRAADLKPF